MTVASNNLTVGGLISDGGSGYSLTKAGTGTLTLTGTADYSGGTDVTAGTLEFAGAAALSSTGILTIASGGEVMLDDLVEAAAPSAAESEPALSDVAVEGTSAVGGISLSRGSGLPRPPSRPVAMLPLRWATWPPPVPPPCPSPPPSSCWLSPPSGCWAGCGGGSAAYAPRPRRGSSPVEESHLLQRVGFTCSW